VSDWAEVFLGVIALATLVMASIQVGFIVFGWLVARRVTRMLTQLEHDLRPLTESLNSMARDAARTTTLAANRVERVDKLLDDLTTRIEHTTTTLQDSILRPLRDGAAVMAGVRTALEVFRDFTKRPGASRTRQEDEDALFIG
jgi:hypothetical protein